MRNTARVMVLAMGLSLAAAAVSTPPVHADTVVDSLGDWVATIGKKDLEKQAILTQRKAARQAAQAERAARKQAKNAAKGMEKAGKDAKKDLGLN